MRIILATAVAAISICSCSVQSKVNYPVSMAHRGCHVDATIPENSISAVKMAARYGFEGIECDVRYTLDSAMVIMHDPTINRTMRLKDGYAPIPEKVKVSETTFDELRTKYVLASDDPAERVQIPTLFELLSACKQYGVVAMLHSALPESYKVAQNMLGDNWICFNEKDDLSIYARTLSNCLILMDPGRDCTSESVIERLSKIGGKCGISSMGYNMLTADFNAPVRAAGYEIQSSIFPTPHEFGVVNDGFSIVLSDFCWYPKTDAKGNPVIAPVASVSFKDKDFKGTGSVQTSFNAIEYAGMVMTLTFEGTVDVLINGERAYTVSHDTMESETIGIRSHAIVPSVSIKKADGATVKSVKIDLYEL